MEAITAGVARPVKVVHPFVTGAGLRVAAGNCLLAASFFIAMVPSARALSWNLQGIANIVWITGAAIMGTLALVRTFPRSTMVNAATITASAGMLLLPCLTRPIGQSTGGLELAGLLFELFGITLTQVARVYMGRSFGVLPANRGIVSQGPFSWVRHPIYLGWMALSMGYVMCYPSTRNILLVAATLPFMVWRIEQEERHLGEDPEYRNYQGHVRFRLFPGVI
jgi:protein-S-isoprenylcysteine O-methyltransferase Ste14